MNLKDTIAADVDAVFFSLDEFADSLTVTAGPDSYEITGMFETIEDSGHTADGVYISEAYLHYKSGDMPRPVNNQLIRISGPDHIDQRYIVITVEDRAGVVAIRLKNYDS